MITITGKCSFSFSVELDVEKFSDIDEENMSIKKSDEIISDAISEKYGINPRDIFVNYQK